MALPLESGKCSEAPHGEWTKSARGRNTKTDPSNVEHRVRKKCSSARLSLYFRHLLPSHGWLRTGPGGRLDARSWWLQSASPFPTAERPSYLAQAHTIWEFLRTLCISLSARIFRIPTSGNLSPLGPRLVLAPMGPVMPQRRRPQFTQEQINQQLSQIHLLDPPLPPRISSSSVPSPSQPPREAYPRTVQALIDSKDAGIEDICSENYQEFTSSVSTLFSVKLFTTR